MERCGRRFKPRLTPRRRDRTGPYTVVSRNGVASAMVEGTFPTLLDEEAFVVRCAWYLVLGVAACSAPAVPMGDPPREIVAMLTRSAADWNRGDLAGFMGDYAHDSLTGYVSGGHVQYGWQVLYDRYEANYFAPGKSRDSLAFEEVRVRTLTPDFAYATARFRLLRGAAVVASGPFTLVLQRQGNRWRILHDHTAPDPKP